LFLIKNSSQISFFPLLFLLLICLLCSLPTFSLSTGQLKEMMKQKKELSRWSFLVSFLQQQTNNNNKKQQQTKKASPSFVPFTTFRQPTTNDERRRVIN